MPGIRRPAADSRKTSIQPGRINGSPISRAFRTHQSSCPDPDRGRGGPLDPFGTGSLLQHEDQRLLEKSFLTSTARQKAFSGGPSNTPRRSWRRSCGKNRVSISATCGDRPLHRGPSGRISRLENRRIEDEHGRGKRARNTSLALQEPPLQQRLCRDDRSMMPRGSGARSSFTAPAGDTASGSARSAPPSWQPGIFGGGDPDALFPGRDMVMEGISIEKDGDSRQPSSWAPGWGCGFAR